MWQDIWRLWTYTFSMLACWETSVGERKLRRRCETQKDQGLLSGGNMNIFAAILPAGNTNLLRSQLPEKLCENIHPPRLDFHCQRISLVHNAALFITRCQQSSSHSNHCSRTRTSTTYDCKVTWHLQWMTLESKSNKSVSVSLTVTLISLCKSHRKLPCSHAFLCPFAWNNRSHSPRLCGSLSF